MLKTDPCSYVYDHETEMIIENLRISRGPLGFSMNEVEDLVKTLGSARLIQNTFALAFNGELLLEVDHKGKMMTFETTEDQQEALDTAYMALNDREI